MREFKEHKKGMDSIRGVDTPSCQRTLRSDQIAQGRAGNQIMDYPQDPTRQYIQEMLKKAKPSSGNENAEGRPLPLTQERGKQKLEDISDDKEKTEEKNKEIMPRKFKEAQHGGTKDDQTKVLEILNESQYMNLLKDRTNFNAERTKNTYENSKRLYPIGCDVENLVNKYTRKKANSSRRYKNTKEDIRIEIDEIMQKNEELDHRGRKRLRVTELDHRGRKRLRVTELAHCTQSEQNLTTYHRVQEKMINRTQTTNRR